MSDAPDDALEAFAFQFELLASQLRARRTKKTRVSSKFDAAALRNCYIKTITLQSGSDEGNLQIVIGLAPRTLN